MKKSELKALIKEVVEEVAKMENPCWKGYKAYGTKQKDGREVPNCVPVEEGNKSDMIKVKCDDCGKETHTFARAYANQPNFTCSKCGHTTHFTRVKDKKPTTESDVDECWECYEAAMQEGMDEAWEECYRKTNWDMIPEGDEHTCEGDGFYEIYGDIKHDPEKIEEAEYQGKKVKLNVPYNNESYLDEAKYHGKNVPLGKKMRGDVKKFKTYVRKPNGKIVKVNYGDKKMRIKKSNPKRRKSFRARHNCANPGPRWKARYWSCRAW